MIFISQYKICMFPCFILTGEFYVLYNGKQKLSDDILRLSTSFKADVDEPQLELKVKVIGNYSVPMKFV